MNTQTKLAELPDLDADLKMLHGGKFLSIPVYVVTQLPSHLSRIVLPEFEFTKDQFESIAQKMYEALDSSTDIPKAFYIVTVDRLRGKMLLHTQPVTTLLPFYDEIAAEVKRAQKLHPDFAQRSKLFRLGVLSEEAGEVARALVQHEEDGEPLEAVRDELIQTAAVCFRFLYSLSEELK